MEQKRNISCPKCQNKEIDREHRPPRKSLCGPMGTPKSEMVHAFGYVCKSCGCLFWIDKFI